MKGLGKLAGVENLCSITLRSLIETENMSSPSAKGQNDVSCHLGHSARVRDEHYVLPDRRWMIQSANRLLFLLEEVGERDDDEYGEEKMNVTTPNCPTQVTKVMFLWFKEVTICNTVC
jgi:hypothetical protein